MTMLVCRDQYQMKYNQVNQTSKPPSETPCPFPTQSQSIPLSLPQDLGSTAAMWSREHVESSLRTFPHTPETGAASPTHRFPRAETQAFLYTRLPSPLLVYKQEQCTG